MSSDTQQDQTCGASREGCAYEWSETQCISRKYMGTVLKQNRLRLSSEDVANQGETEQENVKLREQVSGLSARALQMGATPGRGKAKDKSPRTYSSSHLRLLKRQRKQKCLDSLAWLQSEGDKVCKIELENEVSGNVEEIQVEDLLGTPQGPATQDDFELINMLVYVKDALNVSIQAYHELTQICQSMPRHYHLKRRIKELNSFWKIWPTPHNTCGVQQSLKDRLTERTQALVS